MRLRYIVPTLGLMAASASPAMAADLGNGLTIGGYVDAILEISSLDETRAATVTGDPDDDTIIDFSAAGDLNVGYQVGDAVRGYVEINFSDDDSLDIDEAYAEWMVSDNATLTMGQFHNHLGYEGLDAPELFRVNNSQMFNMTTGADVTGAAVGFAGSENIDVGIYLVDGFGILNDGTNKEGTDLGIGAAVTIAVEGVGFFDVDLAYDIAGGGGMAGDADDVLYFGVNGEIDSLKESNGLLFGFDLAYVDYDDDNMLGIMAMANYALGTEFPASLTLMIDYIDPASDGDDDEIMEIAVALLTNPTSDDNFALNVEARYIDRGQDDNSEFGLFVEALAVIP